MSAALLLQRVKEAASGEAAIAALNPMLRKQLSR
jgi:hypothetical protein